MAKFKTEDHINSKIILILGFHIDSINKMLGALEKTPAYASCLFCLVLFSGYYSKLLLGFFQVSES